MLVYLIGHLGLGGVFLVAGLDQLGRLVPALLHRFHIGEDQLQVDGLNIPGGVHAAVHVDDVVVLKAAHHVHDGVAFPDVGKKLVAQALAMAGALYQSGDIHKFHAGGGHLFGTVHLGQHVQSAVGHRHHAGVGLNGTEGIIGRLRAGVGNGVEKRAFAHIGQSYDTKLHVFLHLLVFSEVQLSLSCPRHGCFMRPGARQHFYYSRWQSISQYEKPLRPAADLPEGAVI